MRGLGIVLLLSLTTLAGCLDADADEPLMPDGRPLEAATGAVFHTAAQVGANATLLNIDIDPALVPVGAMRYLGSSTFEPTVGSDADGCIYMTSFRGTGTGTRVFMSCDAGATWEDIGPNAVDQPQDIPVVGPVGTEPCFRNSNDPYVHVDRDTGRVFSSDLHALLSSTLHYTDDKGETWTCNVFGGGLPPGVHDHQTIATGTPRTLTTVGYDNIVYYCVNRVADSVCATSLNGGAGFGPFVPVYPGVEAHEESGEPQLCGGLHGHAETDHAGRVFLPKGQCGNVEVAVSDDDGLTWTRSVVSRVTGVQGHEVRVAADEADNIYAFWIGGDDLPYLAVSEDHGQFWGPPLMVGAPGVTYAGLPAVYAGAEGMVAFAYVGSETTDQENATGLDQVYNGYIGVIYDALTETPTVATVTANDPADPIHATQYCGSARCGGLGDFIDLTITPDGRPWAAFSDQCDDICRDNPFVGNHGGNRAFVGTFETGRSLLTGEALEPLAPLVEATQ